MKKGVEILSWSAFTLVVLILLVFVDYSYSAIPCRAPEVNIIQEDGHQFITEELVLDKISNLGYSLDNSVYKDIEVADIENEIRKTAGVKEVEVLKLNNGVVVLNINENRPIARIINVDGLVSFYLDEEGGTMPLSQNYVARVPVFTGDIYYSSANVLNAKEIKSNDSLKALHLLDNIYDVALAIDKDNFIKAQTLQIYVNRNKEFELIPRVGRNRILLGSSEDIENKLKKLKRFYTEAIKPQELNNYDTISLKYHNQIICSKR